MLDMHPKLKHRPPTPLKVEREENEEFAFGSAAADAGGAVGWGGEEGIGREVRVAGHLGRARARYVPACVRVRADVTVPAQAGRGDK
eukprot:CAMPEP_0206274376 /NCGR_PEP_ID=MMETSP0047_2-20121206/35122_1 /ASSEMBLY_ACC=CAM_ASM_000192 /TAXON_ID=195065 /ORGANISM="Chroomonas mesostigmatica_cf, Strain CCMP1168" /LENGTH=86 /DNA_ID=CAMNT_0053703587 /DNA_START=520 /DNA_END=777 /DNA_ORIENTATION=+